MKKILISILTCFLFLAISGDGKTSQQKKEDSLERYFDLVETGEFNERKDACKEIIRKNGDTDRLVNKLNKIFNTRQDVMLFRTSVMCAKDLAEEGEKLAPNLIQLMERSIEVDRSQGKGHQWYYLQYELADALAAVAPGNKEAAQVLVKVSRHVSNGTLEYITPILGVMGSSTKDRLSELLFHENRRIRRAAAIAMRNFEEDGEELLPTLIKGLDDQDEGVVSQVLETINSLGLANKAKPQLEKFLTDSRYSLAQQAAFIIHSPDLRFYPKGFLDGDHRRYDKIDKTIPLYETANGERVGEAKLRLYTGVGSAYILELQAIQNKPIKPNPSDVFNTGYQNEYAFLKYYDEKRDHIQILVNSIRGGVWIDKKDINEFIRPSTWIEDIIKNSKSLLYGYDGYRLRTQPSADGKIIVTLDTNRFVIKEFTKNVKGSWAEAIVFRLRGPLVGCYSDEELKKAQTGKILKGWIKVVDDNGLPKDIKYYSSC